MQAFASRAGIALSTWSEFERPIDRPHAATTEAKVAKALGWPYDALERIRQGEDPTTFTVRRDDTLIPRTEEERAMVRVVLAQMRAAKRNGAK